MPATRGDGAGRCVWGTEVPVARYDVTAKVASVLARPNAACSWLPVTVLRPRLPTTTAETIRGEHHGG